MKTERVQVKPSEIKSPLPTKGQVQYKTKDSGKRTEFETGAQREIIAGKGRYDLLSPLANRRLAEIFERGSKKYSSRNWEKGMPLSKFVDSANRHINQHMEGLIDEDHLGQALWNVYAAVHIDEAIKLGILPKELDDLPYYRQQGKTK